MFYISQSWVAIIVIAQALWALVIPIRNVVIMSNPSFIDDSEVTFTNASYPGFARAMPRLNGPEVLALVRDILELSIGDDTIRRKFEEKGDFVIDDLAAILSPDNHKLFGYYYGLVVQSSEVLAATYTPRTETVVIKDPATNVDKTVTLSCDASDNVLQGMLCVDGTTNGPCDDTSFDNAMPKSTTRLTPVDLNRTVGLEAGWHNSAGLMAFIEFFHQIMRQVFAKKKWSDALLVYKETSVVYNPYRFDIPFTSDNHVIMPDETSFWINDGAYLKLGKSKFVSCAQSEIILGYIYVRRFVADLIQATLVKYDVYNAKSALVETPEFIKERASVVFSAKLSVTIGAGYSSFSDVTHYLARLKMTEKAVSSVLLKRDRAMSGAMLVGSSVRHMWYMMKYPNSFYSYMVPEIRDDTVYLQYRQLGSWHSGFNGMKFDFTRNVMAVIKLEERSRAEGTGISVDWFEQEQAFADWFRAYEVQTGGLVDLVQRRFGDMSVSRDKQVACYQGLLRKIAQVSWIMALRAKPVLNHLVYTAMEAGGDPAGWTLKQMLLGELVVENPYGFRSPISYVRTEISPNLGNAWPMIPLLNALRIGLTSAVVKQMLMTEMNVTYNALIELEAGDTQFRDVVFCPIGVDSMGVLRTDDKPTMYNRIYPALQLLVSDLIDQVDTIHQKMEAEVAPVQVRQEFIAYNRHHAIFNYEGSPVFWQNNALQIGLMRLATKEAPFPTDLAPVRASIVCYNTLELRYLNVSTKCWNEPGSVEETRIKKFSAGLRVIMFSTWSMGVVLNAIGAYVAFHYTYRLVWCWVRSGMKPIPLALAFNLDIQSVGVLSMSRCAIMAFGVIPLIVSYHLPADEEFKRRSNDYPEWIIEFIVAFSMTWFVRLGMELGRYFVYIEYFNRWFYITTTRLRHLCVILTTFIRLGIPVQQGDFNDGILKLCVSCGVSFLMGFVLVLLSRVFRSEGGMARDRVSVLFAKSKLNRVWHGTLGQTIHGWAHFGLLYEGWQVVRRRDKSLSLVKSSFVDLASSADAVVQPLDQKAFDELVGSHHRHHGDRNALRGVVPSANAIGNDSEARRPHTINARAIHPSPTRNDL
ncbi:hypothetical protein PINS_up000443 [Pythium insidiosum]|nr:hypothetical protein PINS_up000443 [Pythium insidiosum]